MGQEKGEVTRGQSIDCCPETPGGGGGGVEDYFEVIMEKEAIGVELH